MLPIFGSSGQKFLFESDPEPTPIEGVRMKPCQIQGDDSSVPGEPAIFYQLHFV